MAIIKCKMCGGDLNINENVTVGTCQYCGSTMTLPSKIDDLIVNLHNRANHFRRNNEFDKAAGVYESILNQDATEAEAYWGLVLCKYGIEYVEDPKTLKRMPTSHRTQYGSIMVDTDYQAALEHADASAQGVYEAEARVIDGIQRQILEISSKEEPFDVFICYKETNEAGTRTPDSVLGQDLYHQLVREGFKVFFSKITLEDKLGTAYEPYIFAALNSAKVMVVVATKPEYVNAVWVKNEWKRYLALIKKGEQKTLIPAYRDMDPYELPDEFAHLQAQDMSKLGFMQDLIRGIKKLVSETGHQDTPQIRTQEMLYNPAAAALLERAFMFLEEGEFTKADELIEQVLNMEPKNAKAYFGKLLIELKMHNHEEVIDSWQPIADNKNFQKALSFANSTYKQELIDYNQTILDKIEQERINYKSKYKNKSMTIILPGNVPMEFVFVEAGEFIMGSDESTYCKPKHKVYLDSYWIGKYPVTNEQYRSFINETKHKELKEFYLERFNDPEKRNWPLFGVGPDDAMAFCVWLSKLSSKYISLPTEAQWEKAVRGIDERKYPWGDEDPIIGKHLKSEYLGASGEVGCNPAGSSPYGVLETSEYPEEWVFDFYDPDYYKRSPKVNPKGPILRPIREQKLCFRGGRKQLKAFDRSQNEWSKQFMHMVGFRCAHHDALTKENIDNKRQEFIKELEEHNQDIEKVTSPIKNEIEMLKSRKSKFIAEKESLGLLNHKRKKIIQSEIEKIDMEIKTKELEIKEIPQNTTNWKRSLDAIVGLMRFDSISSLDHVKLSVLEDLIVGREVTEITIEESLLSKFDVIILRVKKDSVGDVASIISHSSNKSWSQAYDYAKDISDFGRPCIALESVDKFTAIEASRYLENIGASVKIEKR